MNPIYSIAPYTKLRILELIHQSEILQITHVKFSFVDDDSDFSLINAINCWQLTIINNKTNTRNIVEIHNHTRERTFDYIRTSSVLE